jgi:hypothetical protein
MIFICCLSISAASFAKEIYMSVGERRLGSDFASNDVVVCAGNVTPPQPPPPPPPPRPVCNAASVQNQIADLENNIRRVGNGKCGTYYINRCGDNLEEHALGDTQVALANQLDSISRNVQNLCNDPQRACDWRAIQSVMNDYQRVASDFERGQIRYQDNSGQTRTVPMPVSRAPRPYCR